MKMLTSLSMALALAATPLASAHGPGGLDKLASALLGFSHTPSVHETETCAAELNYLAALDADPNVVAIPLPDHGVVTVTRKDVEALVLMMQFAYLANPHGSDHAIDEMIDHSHLGILEGAALSTLAKSTLHGDPAAKEAAITLLMQQAKQKVRDTRSKIAARIADSSDDCTGLETP